MHPEIMNHSSGGILVPDPDGPPITTSFPDVNGTNTSTTSTLAALNNSEIISLCLIGLIGLVGTVMNIGVLYIVYKGRLVKKDYRMIYYIFITVGDLLFAVHTVINSLSILYRDFYVFKIFAVCLNIHMSLGVVTYQWSAMCIILLIIDLIWSLKTPFGSDQHKKTFSKVSCIVAFISGLSSALVPFATWNNPHTLPFCSIANVYGSHWNVYQIEAVTMLSLFFMMMLGASAVLLYTIYSSQRLQQDGDIHEDNDVGQQIKGEIDTSKPAQLVCVLGQRPDVLMHAECPSPHPSKRYDVKIDELKTHGECSSRYCKENITRHSKNDHNSKDLNGKEEIMTVDALVAEEMDRLNENSRHGAHNEGFVMDEINYGIPIHSNATSKLPKIVVKINTGVDTLDDDVFYDNDVHESKSDVQRKQFYTACRNVGTFMVTYLGSCLPYYILLITTINCAPACYQDTSGQRIIRVLVATFLYVLPILDPILYTQRFAIFKEAAREVLAPCFRCFRRNNSGSQ